MQGLNKFSKNPRIDCSGSRKGLDNLNINLEIKETNPTNKNINRPSEFQGEKMLN